MYLYAGHVSFVAPIRDKFSKFFISFEEYEYNKFPPFINAGAYVLSNKAMRKLYLASKFVKLFRFDDAYIGMIAQSLGVKPMHCKHFLLSYDSTLIGNAVASHGFSNTTFLEKTWKRMNTF